MRVILAVLLLLAACGGNYLDELTSQGEEMTKRICACTDLACAQKVVDDLAAWKKGLDAEKIKAAEEKMSAEEKQKKQAEIRATADEFDKCQAKWNDQGLRRPEH